MNFYLSRQNHEIHVQTRGNPNNPPVLMIHGGPGSGMSDAVWAAVSDQTHFLIGFDQRGCGQSQSETPYHANTTQDLISDIQAIFQHFNFKTWSVYGTSWGATLALLYAIEYVDHVKRLIVKGAFFGTQNEIDLLYEENGYAKWLRPQDWDLYKGFIDYSIPHFHGSYVDAYHTILHGHYPALIQEQAACLWTQIEKGASYMIPQDQDQVIYNDAVLRRSLVQTHYFKNACFLSPDYIVKNLHHIRAQLLIIHGQQDLVCPVRNAYLLQRHVKYANLQVIPNAGHSSRTGDMNLIEATQALVRDFL
jgi:proline iminopeptidase